MGQEKYLTGAHLTWRNYQALSAEWEHEHCDFCQRTFLDPHYSEVSRETLAAKPDTQLSAGYTTIADAELKDGELWVCKECFDDFQDEFGWTVVQTDSDGWPYHGPERDRRPTSADYKPPRAELVRRPE